MLVELQEIIDKTGKTENKDNKSVEDTQNDTQATPPQYAEISLKKQEVNVKVVELSASVIKTAPPQVEAIISVKLHEVN